MSRPAQRQERRKLEKELAACLKEQERLRARIEALKKEGAKSKKQALETVEG